MNRGTKFKLLIHSESYSALEVLVNPSVDLPDLKEGDLLEITQVNDQEREKSEDDQVKALAVYKKPDRELQNKGYLSVSTLLATAVGFRSLSEVRVKKVISYSGKFAHSEARDQYIGRSDMWRLKTSLKDSCVYLKKRVIFSGCIQATVRAIYVANKKVVSSLQPNLSAQCNNAYITESTKVIFRSESAKFFLLIQMSQEMWEFDENGELYFEKLTFRLLPELFRRWNDDRTNHICSIVLFTRVYYDQNSLKLTENCSAQTNNGYMDYYKVLLDWESRPGNWLSVLNPIREDIFTFQRFILEKHTDKQQIFGRISIARDGNILEAANLALNAFDKHYVDRDLQRTGLSIVVITPSTGLFHVDKKLLRITTERMFDNGIAMDLLCLTKLPLHTTPVFRFLSRMSKILSSSGGDYSISKHSSTAVVKVKNFMHKRTVSSMEAALRSSAPTGEIIDPLYEDLKEQEQQTIEKEFFSLPYWVVTGFFDYEEEKPLYERADSAFFPRCKLPALQNMAVSELDLDFPDIPPLLSPDQQKDYDENVFKTVSGEAFPSLSFRQVSPPTPLGQPFPPLRELNRELRSMTMVKSGESDDFIKRRRSRDSEREVVTDDFLMMSEAGAGGGSGGSVKPILIKSARSRSNTLNMSRSEQSYSWEMMMHSPIGKYSSSRQVVRQSVVNPCYPVLSDMQQPSGHLRRWEHIYPVPETRGYHVNWLSLCTPACLPLGTEYHPTKAELKEFYQVHCHTVSLADELMGEDLLRELISQRLAQGFQLLSKAAFGECPTPSAAMTYDEASLMDEEEEIDNVTGFASVPHYLSMGHHVHRLAYDPTQRNVDVQRYVRKLHYAMEPIEYKCHVWSKFRDGYELRQVCFKYPYLSSYNWNYLDQYIAGHEQEMTDALRFWRTRFILIPHDDQGGDERKFCKFLELFEKVAGRSKSSQPLETLGIILTEKTVAEYVRASHFAAAAPSYLTKNSDLSIVVEQIDKNVRKRGEFDRLFIGSDLIEWMIKGIQDISTRKEAIEFSNHLISLGVIEHYGQKLGCLDVSQFYRLKVNSMGGGRKRKRVEISKKMQINIDVQRRSDRRELAVLHYDVIHNLKSCYHFHLNWINCTARMIEDLLHNWGRAAERQGWKLVEAPVEQAQPLNDNPFQAALEIPLAVPAPSLEELGRLAKSFGFILDVEADSNFPSKEGLDYSYFKTEYAYTQYVHRSGVAFLLLRGVDNFLFVHNRLMASHATCSYAGSPSAPTSSSAGALANPDIVRRQVQEVCSNQNSLKDFWASSS